MVNQLLGNHGLGIVWCGQFDLGPLLQGQTRIAKPKSAYNSLIIGRTGLGWLKPTYRKSWVGNLLVWSDFILDPPSRSNEHSQTYKCF